MAIKTNGMEATPSENWSKFPDGVLDALEAYTANELKILLSIIAYDINFDGRINFWADYIRWKSGMDYNEARNALVTLNRSGALEGFGEGWGRQQEDSDKEIIQGEPS